ncbi:MAG: hypothetical protein ACK5SB_03325 [Flavobacterium sp.]|jgi:hypothetical protein
MKNLCILLLAYASFSQTKFQVLDSITHQPVSYANIWNEKQIIRNSDSLGFFEVPMTEQKLLKITAIGYEEKVFRSNESPIYLKPVPYLLDEVVIRKPKNTNPTVVAKASRKGQAFYVQYDAQSVCVVKFVKGDAVLKFLKSITFYSRTSSNQRKIALIFYSVNANGAPGELLNTETLICNLKKGDKETVVDVTDQVIEVPKEGLFVGLQHLLIEENKNYSHDKNATQLSFFYEPGIFFWEDTTANDSWCFYNNQWKLYPTRSLNLGIELTE